jgi:hypothetical protein
MAKLVYGLNQGPHPTRRFANVFPYWTFSGPLLNAEDDP